jgi:hypothetical protein
MPLSRHHRQNSRRRRGLAHVRQQHGAARRATDAARDRQSGGLSRTQSRPRRQFAAGKARKTVERVAAIKRSDKAWPVIVANMVERGATATPDEAKTITDYLAANFGN